MWINLKNMMLSENSHHQRIYHFGPISIKVRIRQKLNNKLFPAHCIFFVFASLKKSMIHKKFKREVTFQGKGTELAGGR